MGKIYGKQDGSNELIIDGDALEQRISDLEANWESISRVEITGTYFSDNATSESKFYGYRYPALKLCILYGHVTSAVQASSNVVRTVGYLDQKEYAPSQYTDMFGSSEANIFCKFVMRPDGMMTICPINGSPAKGSTYSFIGIWFYD